MNNITLAGNVGKAPELFDLESGCKVARFSIAVKNPYKQSDTPMWIDVEAWGKTAERVISVITQGREVIVQGNLTLNEFESAKDGKVHVKPIVRLSQFTVCGPKPQDDTAMPAKPTKRRKSA